MQAENGRFGTAYEGGLSTCILAGLLRALRKTGRGRIYMRWTTGIYPCTTLSS